MREGPRRFLEVPGSPGKTEEPEEKTIVVVLMLSGPGSALRTSDIGSPRIGMFDSSGD